MVKAEATDAQTVVGDARRQAERATRSCPSPAPADLLQGLLHRRTRSIPRRSTRRSAPAPTRSAGSAPAASSNTSASTTTGARTCRSMSATPISTSSASTSSSERAGRVRGLQEGRDHLPRGVHLDRPGRQGYDFPAVDRGQGQEDDRLPDRKAAVDARLVLQHAAGEIRAIRGRGTAIGLAFDFEWSNTNLFFDSYTRLHSYFEHSDFMARRHRRATAELALLEPFRGAICRRRCSARPTCRRRPTARAATARSCKQATDLLADAGWKQIGNATRRRGRRRPSRSNS